MKAKRIWLVGALTLIIFFVLSAIGADKKISNLPLLPAASWQTVDLVPIIDLSPTPTTKNTTIGDFDLRYLLRTDTIGIANGGTGLTSTPNNGQVLIGNGSSYSLSTLSGTANQVSVTNGSGTITLSTPQDVHSGASPTFAGLTVGSGTGPLRVSSGVLGTGSLDLATEVTGTLANSNTTATNANTPSAIVSRDASGNFSAGTISASLTGAVTGNADTASALASNPSDCASDTYATTIAANGNLTCSTVTNAGLAGSIAASKLVGTDIDTVGTVTTGTWSASTIALNKGGTGQTTKAAAFDALSPMTASGDIIYGGASGTGTRLAAGSDGQVLTLASGLPSWAAAPASSLAVSAKTANYTLVASTDDVVTGATSGGAFTLTLPTAVGITGKVFRIIKTDSSTNRLTIARTSSQTIGGLAVDRKMGTQGDTLAVMSDGSNWVLLEDGITIAVIANGNPQNSYTANTVINYPTTYKDTNGLYSSGQVTVEIPGFYYIQCFIDSNVSNAYVSAYVAGSKVAPGMGTILSSLGAGAGSTLVYAGNGDTIDCRSATAWTNAAFSGNNGFSLVRVH